MLWGQGVQTKVNKAKGILLWSKLLYTGQGILQFFKLESNKMVREWRTVGNQRPPGTSIWGTWKQWGDREKVPAIIYNFHNSYMIHSCIIIEIQFESASQNVLPKRPSNRWDGMNLRQVWQCKLGSDSRFKMSINTYVLW